MQSTSFFQGFVSRPEFGPFVLLVGEVAVFAARSPAFLSAGNISNLLAFTPELGMITLGMTLLMISGEFDLSVGSVFGFAPIVMWTFYNTHTTPLEAGFLIAMALAVVVGFANGWLVTFLKIPSFLVTLGMLLVVRGTALYITDGFPQRTWTSGSALMKVIVGEFSVGPLRIYASLLWFILFAVVSGYVLTQSKAGNWMFIFSALISAYAGITSSIRVSAANPNSGTGYELEVIAMVVIGGTALSGGRGTIIGTVIGVLILRTMRNGIVLIGVPGLAYNIFIGAIILGMMTLHSWLERRHHAGT